MQISYLMSLLKDLNIRALLYQKLRDNRADVKMLTSAGLKKLEARYACFVQC